MEPIADTKKSLFSVQHGPVEGMLLVDGRPAMEAVDMPVISFDSIQAIEHFLASGRTEETKKGGPV